MKLNWGNVLLLFFILYISLLVRIVIKSIHVDHTLVVDNYYEHDINYQAKVDMMNNRQLLKNDLSISVDKESQKLRLDFGGLSEIAEATVEFYRASDKGSDIVKNLQNITTSTEIEIGDLQTGLWKVKVEWRDDQRSYFKEQNFYI